MKKKYISIIISTLNRLDYLEKCLKSIREQNYLDYCVTLIDDGSNEDLSPIKKYCDKLIRNDINLGPAYSRNLGALNSDSEIILFLDSDTVLLQGTLKKLQELFESDSSIGVIGGSGPSDETGEEVHYIVGKSYDWLQRSKSNLYYVKDNSSDSIYDCDHLESAFLAVRRDIFEKIGGFDPYWFYIGEDRDFCLSVRKLGHRVVASLPTRTIHHAVHSYKYTEKELTTFAYAKYLEVAIKQGSIFGGIKWMLGNIKKIIKNNDFSYIFESFKKLNELALRKKTDFLNISELEKYYVVKSANELNKFLPFKVNYPLPTPKNIMLFITLKCNASCKHCFISYALNTGVYEMKFDEITKIIDSLNSETNISLTGGETFLRTDLSDILNMLMKSRNVISVRMNSNGAFPDKIESICKEICAKYKKPLTLQLSLDGLEETHDRIRKIPNGFKKVIETCERTKKIKDIYSSFNFVVSITIMRENIEEIERLVDYLEEKKYPSKLCIVRGNSFSTYDVPEDILDKAYEPPENNLGVDIQKTHNIIKNIENKHPLYFNGRQKQKLELSLKTLLLKKRQIPCYAGYADCVIFSDGHIAICEQVKPFGNLSKWNFNIADAWNSKESWEHRRKLTKCSCINGCNLLSSISIEKDKKSKY